MLLRIIQFIDSITILGAYSGIVIIFMLILGLGLWSAVSRSRLSYLISGPAATKLYLGVEVRRLGLARDGAGGSGFLAHVVDLDMTHVMFITHTPVAKGERLAMSFAKVPDFRAAMDPYVILAEGCRKIYDSSGAYFVKAHFVGMPSSARSPLEAFTRQLMRQRNLSPVPGP